MPKNGPNSRNFYLMQAHCQSKLGRELGRRQVLGGACLLTVGMRVYIYEIGRQAGCKGVDGDNTGLCQY